MRVIGRQVEVDPVQPLNSSDFLLSFLPFFPDSFLQLFLSPSLPTILSFLLSSFFFLPFFYLSISSIFHSLYLSLHLSLLRLFVCLFLPLIAHYPLQCLHHFGFALSSLLITCGKHSAALLSQAWEASSRAASKIGSHPPRCLLTPEWEEEKEKEEETKEE